MSTIQLSLKLLRKGGWIAEKVEKPWNQYVRRTQDLFGFGDILAFKGERTVIVQTTTDKNVNARLAKIHGIRIAAAWVKSRHRAIVVHGWACQGPRGKRKVWVCREVVL